MTDEADRIVPLRDAATIDTRLLSDMFTESMRDHITAARGGVWDERRERDQFHEQLDLPSTRIIQDNGIDVGFLTIKRMDGDLEVHTLCVIPTFQHRGIGSSVMRAVIAMAGEAGEAVAVSVLRRTRVRERSTIALGSRKLASHSITSE